MNKFFNEITIAFGLLGGSISYLLGGFDNLLQFLVGLMILDWVTGMMKATITHSIDSGVGFVGIYKKIAMLIIVGIAWEIDKLTNNATLLREIVIFFYIANEGISIIENLSTFIPIPDSITKYFQKIKGDDKNE